MAVNVQPLSPWPATGTPTQRERAIARLREAIQGRAADSDEAACALGELAAARVELEAPDAPQAVRDECVIRYAGYMAQADFGGVVDETIGPMSITYTVNHAAAFRNCGAAGLLAPWKVRRAGAIG